jgi:predicted lipoprotein with Yx(FWY)xxD motif
MKEDLTMRAWNYRTARTALLAVVVTAFIGASIAYSEGTVQVAKKQGIGSYLADAKGMTLYIFKRDSPGKSACAGPCVEKWPLFHSEKVTAPVGLKAADFGTITRDDGKKQTTYKGMPLYYFFKDTQRGDTKGQGVGDLWYVATP